MGGNLFTFFASWLSYPPICNGGSPKYKSPPQTTVKKYPANRPKGFVTHASTRNCVSAAASAAAVARLWPLSLRPSFFVLARAGGRGSARQCLEPRPKRLRAGRAFQKETKQACFLRPLYNPAICTTCYVDFVQLLATPVLAPTQNTLFVEDFIAVRREFSSFLSWGFLIYSSSPDLQKGESSTLVILWIFIT